MSDRRTITDAYQRHEDEAGGYASPSYDPKRIIATVARDLGIPKEDVQAVMENHWTQLGAG